MLKYHVINKTTYTLCVYCIFCAVLTASRVCILDLSCRESAVRSKPAYVLIFQQSIFRTFCSLHIEPVPSKDSFNQCLIRLGMPHSFQDFFPMHVIFTNVIFIQHMSLYRTCSELFSFWISFQLNLCLSLCLSVSPLLKFCSCFTHIAHSLDIQILCNSYEQYVHVMPFMVVGKIV